MAMNMDAMLRIKADVQGENNIRRLGSSLQNLQGQAKTVGMGFNALKGAVAGFGAAIAGSAIVGGLTAIVKKSIDAGDELFVILAFSGGGTRAAALSYDALAELRDTTLTIGGRKRRLLDERELARREFTDATAGKSYIDGTPKKKADLTSICSTADCPPTSAGAAPPTP